MRSRSPGPPPTVGMREDSWVRLLVALLQARSFTARLACSLLVVVVLVTVLQPRTYTTSAAFIPQSQPASMNRLAGLAAQFGIATPVAGIGTSPEFYADLLRSGQILRPVILSQYALTRGGDSLRGTLIDLYEIEAPTDGRRLADAVRRVRRDLNARVDPKTYVVRISVAAPDALLSKAIVDRLLDEVNAFNLRSRQSQAGEERRFIEGRLRSAYDELRQSENALESFLLRNREYRNAPSLAFQYDRLQRDVMMHQQVYTTLAQNYEQARIEEVRNTPVITLVESPIVAPTADRRYLLAKGLLALVVGSLFAAVLIVLRELLGGASGLYGEGAGTLDAILANTRADLRRPWRLLVPGPKGGSSPGGISNPPG